MTTMLVVNILAVVVVGFTALRRGRDRRVDGLGFVRGLMIAGLVPLGLQAIILTLFGFGEMASGDLSGAGHLVSLAATVLLAFLAWKRPIEGGVALVIVGIASAPQYRDAIASIIMVAPQLVSGALFLVAGTAGWSASAPRAH